MVKFLTSIILDVKGENSPREQCFFLFICKTFLAYRSQRNSRSKQNVVCSQGISFTFLHVTIICENGLVEC